MIYPTYEKIFFWYQVLFRSNSISKILWWFGWGRVWYFRRTWSPKSSIIYSQPQNFSMDKIHILKLWLAIINECLCIYCCQANLKCHKSRIEEGKTLLAMTAWKQEERSKVSWLDSHTTQFSNSLSSYLSLSVCCPFLLWTRHCVSNSSIE